MNQETTLDPLNDMKQEVAMLAQRVAQIESRNRAVEVNKAWEISLVRRTTIALLTYCAACLYLLCLGDGHAFLTALIPTGGYTLSVLSLPVVRRVWEAKQRHSA